MKLHIWGEGFHGVIVEPDQIESRFYTGESALLIEGLSEEQTAQLYEQPQKILDSIKDDEDLEGILKGLGIENAQVHWAEDLEKVRDVLAFDTIDHSFFDLADAPEVSVLEYWDGSNHRNLVLTENLTETVLEVSDAYVSLDEWDGRNPTTGGTGHHQRVYQVLTEDGEKPEEALYLVEAWSQWQGETLPHGKIVDESGLRTHLKELGRDVNDYMGQIRK